MLIKWAASLEQYVCESWSSTYLTLTVFTGLPLDDVFIC